MAGFGRFESVDELASAGQVEVHAARPAGESGPPRFVVKTFQTLSEFADPEVVEREAEFFLQRARRQAELAKKSPERWAPVHEAGRTETHAYYVTDRYELTGQRLVDSRRELTARAIVDVVGGVADALGDLDGRPHGAIKGGNVMLAGGGDALEGVGVLLADPAAPGQLDANSPVDDVRQLAGFMHQIVTHRPAPRAGAVERSDDWSRMGGQGEALRVLCEQWLNTAPGTPLPTPADMRARLRECLKAKGAPKGTPKALIAVIAAVVLLGGGAGAYFFLGGTQENGVRTIPDRRLDLEAGVATAAQWLEKEELEASSIVKRVNEQVETSVKVFSEEDTKKWDEAVAAFNVAVERVRAHRGVPWPEDVTPDLPARQLAVDSETRTLGETFRLTFQGVKSLEGALKTPTAEDDPRGGRPDVWAQRLRARATDAFSRAQAEMSDGGGEGDAALAKMAEQQAALFKEIDEAAAVEWSPTPPTGADGQPDLMAGAEQREANRRRVKELVRPEEGQKPLATRVTEFVDLVKKASSESRSGVERQIAAAIEAWSAPAAEGPGSAAAIREAASARLRRVQRAFLETTGGAGLAQARRDMRGVEEWAKGVYDAAPTFTAPGVPAGSAVNVRPLIDAMARRRDEVLAEAAKVVADDNRVPDANDTAYWSGVRARAKSATDFGAAGVALVSTGVAIESLLAQGMTLSEAPATGAKTLANLRDDASGNAAFGELGAMVAPVLARVTELERIAGLENPSDLLTTITEAANGPDASRAVTAWRTLLTRGYPARAADLSTLAGVRADAYERAIAGVPDAGRRAALSDAGKANVRDAWFAFANDRANGVVAEVEAAFGAMAAAGVSEGDLAKAQPWVRRNYGRYQFAARVRAIADGRAEDQINAVAPVVKAWLDAERAAGSAPAWETLFRALDPVAAGKVTDLTKDVGPARVGWTGRFGAGADGSVMNYAWTAPSGRSYDLEFVRVSNSADGAVYVCTEEASVGLFIDLMTAANQWEDIAKAHGRMRLNAQSVTARRGPSAWTWVAGEEMEISERRENDPRRDPTGAGWLVSTNALPETGYYDPQLPAPTPPNANSPMTRVPAAAALLAASWAGCRLPSPGEWQLAADTGPGDANRRDATWATQHAYIAQLKSIIQNGARPYDKLQFPMGDHLQLQGERVQDDADGTPAVTETDGVLWFRDVTAGTGRFKNLVGNAAEWVHENPAAMDALPVRATLASCREALGGTSLAGLGVIGGSAMSGGTIEPRQTVRALGRGEEAAGFRASTSEPQGFSDVGFRLAFSSGAGGGAGTPKDRVLAQLAGTAYLTGSTP
ncbi:MAG: hypothetical protein SFY69_08610 [Planctomycetota bacterium]|nr:hypothetical protein [Planctomycetota bacterium]